MKKILILLIGVLLTSCWNPGNQSISDNDIDKVVVVGVDNLNREICRYELNVMNKIGDLKSIPFTFRDSIGKYIIGDILNPTTITNKQISSNDVDGIDDVIINQIEYDNHPYICWYELNIYRNKITKGNGRFWFRDSIGKYDQRDKINNKIDVQERN